MTTEHQSYDAPREDRLVHAECSLFSVARYERAGHWYVELKTETGNGRRRVSVNEAAKQALRAEASGGLIHSGAPGGQSFDRWVMKLRGKKSRVSDEQSALLRAASARPWKFYAGFPPWLKDVKSKPGGHLVSTGSVYSLNGDRPVLYKPNNADAALVVRAVNEYEVLSVIADIVAARRERIRQGIFEPPSWHPRTPEEIRLDAALEELEAIRCDD